MSVIFPLGAWALPLLRYSYREGFQYGGHFECHTVNKSVTRTCFGRYSKAYTVVDEESLSVKMWVVYRSALPALL